MNNSDLSTRDLCHKKLITCIQESTSNSAFFNAAMLFLFLQSICRTWCRKSEFSAKFVLWEKEIWRRICKCFILCISIQKYALASMVYWICLLFSFARELEIPHLEFQHLTSAMPLWAVAFSDWHMPWLTLESYFLCKCFTDGKTKSTCFARCSS